MKDCVRIAICEDSDSDRRELKTQILKYLDENGLYVSIDEFHSGEDFLKTDLSEYNLVFMDIFMEGINGMETARVLMDKNKRVQVVFTSTSIEFAAEAFSIEALHYIVKPVDEKQLYRVLDKFIDGLYSIKTVEIKVKRLVEDIYISDILYVEAAGKKNVIHMKNGVVEASQSLAEMAQILPADSFEMPIRWALVSMREVTAVYAGKLVLSDQTEIPVSRYKREEFKKKFADFRWTDMRRRMGGR